MYHRCILSALSKRKKLILNTPTLNPDSICENYKKYSSYLMKFRKDILMQN